MPKEKQLTIGAYALLKNVDNSILLLNKYTRKFGFEFVQCQLDELERDFRNVFHYTPEESPRKVNLSGSIINNSFQYLLHHSPFVEFGNLHEHGYVIFLKNVEPEQYGLTGAGLEATHARLSELQKFIYPLLTKLRLFKVGDIKIATEFDIIIESGKMLSQHWGNDIPIWPIKNYIVTDDALDELIRFLEKDIIPNKLNSVALRTFETSFVISDDSIRYITLMTCLESLFNLGKDQIAHTISRHTAIITSSNSTEFKANYKLIKKLYQVRSDIVHGGTSKGVNEAMPKLENLVRYALVFTIKNSFQSKEEMFEYFNSTGFSK